MTKEEKPKPKQPHQLGIHYIRSRHYRTIHADGAQFGLTPQAYVQFTLFSDQKPMPEFVMHKVTAEGKLGEPIEEVVKTGIVREVEINVVMNPTAAASFIEVMQNTLKQIQEFLARQQASGSSPEKKENA